MNIFDLIKNRRTIHLYKPDLVSEKIFERALELAVYAPNHKLTYPWFFRNITLDERQKLGKKFVEVSHLLVVGIRKSSDAFRAKEDYATLAMSLQNMSLYLWSEGVGTKWSTGSVTTADSTYELLGVNKNEIELCGFFWIGYASVTPEPSARPDWRTFFK